MAKHNKKSDTEKIKKVAQTVLIGVASSGTYDLLKTIIKHLF